MKNAAGMIRSNEVMRAQKPVIHHFEIHPQMGGGVRFEHHHTEPGAHPPKIHNFGPDDGMKFHDHVAQHTGMSWEPEEGGEAAAGNEGAENQVDHAGV